LGELNRVIHKLTQVVGIAGNTALGTQTAGYVLMVDARDWSSWPMLMFTLIILVGMWSIRAFANDLGLHTRRLVRVRVKKC
jgi:hypothetical protein